MNEGAVFIWGSEPYPEGIFMDLAVVVVPIPPLPVGTLVDNIIFHCEVPGDVTLTLVGDYENGIEVLDTQIIHQLPEPMTMCLLGLGGLFLRRRSK